MQSFANSLAKRNTSVVLMASILVVVAFLFLLNLTTGSVNIPFASALHILLGNEAATEAWNNIIIKSRLPQALTALIAGASLAVSGLQMQTLFRNPLAGPAVLGISSGASLGVAIVLLIVSGLTGVSLGSIGLVGDMGVSIAAFLGALAVLALIMLASRYTASNTVLLIIGIMIGYASSSLVGILKFYSTASDLKSYVIWGLGSFSNITLSEMPLFIIGLSVFLLLSFFIIKPMNLYMLGENYAQNLGVNVKLIRLLMILFSGFLVALTTAYTGPIAFLGLAVPHIARNLFLTSDNRILLPGVILTGSAVALLCNFIARLPGFEGALPINTVTSIIGAPIVIWVIIRQRRGYE